MPVLSISGQTLRITRQALDAAGIPCVAGGGASTNFNDYKFIDNTGLEWEVKAFSGWDATGKATFDLKIPTVTTPETRTINRTYKGESFLFSPDPLVTNLFPPYQGNFDLTDALVASDCTPNLSDLSNLPDYTGNCRNLGRRDGGSLVYPFTNTSQYKTTSTGSLVTLGRNCIGQSRYSDFTDISIMEPIYAEELCTGKNGLPPKISVLEGVFIRIYMNNTMGMPDNMFIRYNYRLAVNGNLKFIGILYTYDRQIHLVIGNNNQSWTSLGYMSTTAPLNVLPWTDQIIHVALRISWANWDEVTSSGIPTISMYINGIKRLTYTLPSIQTYRDTTWLTTYLSNNFYLLGYGGISSGGQQKTAALDFAAYPSTHTDEQILNNAKAWGLA